MAPLQTPFKVPFFSLWGAKQVCECRTVRTKEALLGMQHVAQHPRGMFGVGHQPISCLTTIPDENIPTQRVLAMAHVQSAGRRQKKKGGAHDSWLSFGSVFPAPLSVDLSCQNCMNCRRSAVFLLVCQGCLRKDLAWINKKLKAGSGFRY